MRTPDIRTRAGARRRVVLANKPYGVLCQFTSQADRATLADIVPVRDVYPAGRLDADSEGLVVLTDDGALQARIADPRHALAKRYFAQVEGEPSDAAIAALARGVDVGEFVTRPARVARVEAPAWLWPRDPPIRFRKSIATSWLSIEIAEGKNRQVRRMTAAVGHPTLRLVRWSVGPWTIAGLAAGAWRFASAGDLDAVAARARPPRRRTRGRVL